MEKKMASLTKIIKEYARQPKQYQAGWDIVVETMTDEEIGQVVNKANTDMGAKRLMSRHIRPLIEHRAEAQATAF
jgi:tRNA U55 pseudouridine synthase TruB